MKHMSSKLVFLEVTLEKLLKRSNPYLLIMKKRRIERNVINRENKREE